MYKLEINLKTISQKNFEILLPFLKKLEKRKLLKKKDLILINSIPTKKKLITVLKSPHVHKKSREQFKYQLYKKKLIITKKTLLPLLYIDMLFKNFLNKDFKILSKIIKLSNKYYINY